MICSWCGGRIESDEDSFWTFWAGVLVHWWCFRPYFEDRREDREELLERLEFGGEG